VTDAGLAHLADRTDLEALALRETAITDAGLVHLKGLINLKRLFLGGTQITDAGLVHLRGLKRLQLLEVGSTRVTDTAVRPMGVPRKQTCEWPPLARRVPVLCAPRVQHFSRTVLSRKPARRRRAAFPVEAGLSCLQAAREPVTRCLPCWSAGSAACYLACSGEHHERQARPSRRFPRVEAVTDVVKSGGP
jgi:hypothetical protein